MERLEQPQFATARLILRPRTLGDLEACVAVNSDPAVMRFLGPVWPPDRQRAHLTAQMTADHGDGLGYWAIRWRDSDELLGWVMLGGREPGEEPALGYRLKRSAWGQGVATEAARAILDYGLTDRRVGSVQAVVHRDNAGSHKVLGKLGFALVGPVSRGPMPEVLYRVGGRA